MGKEDAFETRPLWRPRPIESVVLPIEGVYHPIKELQRHVDGSERSINECQWFRPVIVADALIDETELDPAQQEFHEKMHEAFLAGGHARQTEPTEDSEIILAYPNIPRVDRPLRERLIEEENTLAEQVRDSYNIEGLHPNLIPVVTVTDNLLDMPHTEVEDVARTAMGRIGAFKVLFIKVNEDSLKPKYYVFTTIEGGHSTTFGSDPNCFEELRDRLVTHACANEAGGYEAIRNAISKEDWANCRTIDYIINAGRKLGELDHLDPPFDVEQWTSRERAQLVKFLLGWQRQAAGAIIAFAPNLQIPDEYGQPPFTGTPIVTCTGREEVDKTNMQRDEVVAVSLEGNVLHAFGVGDGRIKAPSIEGDELVGGIIASPPVRLIEHPQGYAFDPDGDIVVPRIWAIVHIHRGVEEVHPIRLNGQDVHVVEHILPNVEQFPYAVGCGKDMMFEISRDAMARSQVAQAAEEFDSPAVVGMFDVANHGTNFFLYCAPRPGTNIIPRDPFENFLNLVDPDAYGAIKLTTEVPQI